MVYSLSEWIYLSNYRIDENVTRTSPGVYALSSRYGGSIEYVGRADKDLKDRLKKHIGGKYGWFRFDYATSPKNAFEKECEVYHDFNPPDNEIHPRRPDGTNWKCPNPHCKVFD